MRSAIIRRAQRRLIRHLRSTCTQVRATPTQGLFNFRCHENCVEYLRLNRDRDLEVVETIYVDGGDPVLHYLVRDRASGELLEVTLGWRAEHLEYYMTRALLPADHAHIHGEFNRSLAHWLDAYVSRPVSWLLRIDRIL